MGSYGNINKVTTVGASYITAKEGEKLSYDGVPASEKMAADDLEAMKEYKSMIVRVGRQKGVDPAVIAGIISRESRAGKAIRYSIPPGWGDYRNGRYNGFGLMQVDILEGKRKPIGPWDSEEHLKEGTGELIKSIGLIQNKFSKWSKEQQLKGGLAAYNMGVGNVMRHVKCRGRGGGWQSVDDSYTGDFDSDHSYAFVDINTTGQDYSNDVVARAQWYKKHGY